MGQEDQHGDVGRQVSVQFNYGFGNEPGQPIHYYVLLLCCKPKLT